MEYETNDEIVAIPPGATIQEHMDYEEYDVDDLAYALNLPKKKAKKLLHGKLELTERIAEKLEAWLGLPASFWINLEKNYRDKLEKIQDDEQGLNIEEI